MPAAIQAPGSLPTIPRGSSPPGASEGSAGTRGGDRGPALRCARPFPSVRQPECSEQGVGVPWVPRRRAVYMARLSHGCCPQQRAVICLLLLSPQTPPSRRDKAGDSAHRLWLRSPSPQGKARPCIPRDGGWRESGAD